jgi:hypothetical protein
MARSIRWLGPFGWPKFEGELPPIPNVVGGVYLETFEYKNGYIIECAGYTTRLIRQRLLAHTRCFMSGTYCVLDITAAQLGRRKAIWKGFWNWAGQEPSRKDKAEYRKRQIKIQDAARKQLEGFRVFVANLGTEIRYLRRVESAIMRNLDKQPASSFSTPSRDMSLSERWESERPITIYNECSVTIHGLPSRLII